MASSDAVTQGKALELKKIFTCGLITGMTGMVIQHVGDQDYGTVEINSSGDIILIADDTDGNTTTILTCDVSDAAYNTFALCRDAINATEEFRCLLIGVRPSDTSTDMLATMSQTQIGPGTAYEANGISVPLDATTTSQVYGFAITNQKFTACKRTVTGDYSNKVKNWTKDTNCINGLEYISLNLTVSGNGSMYIYAVDDATDTEVQIYPTEAFTSATAESHGNPGTPWVEAPLGCRLVVQFAATTAANDFTAATVYCLGYTRDVVGGRVPPGNYSGCT